MTAAMKPTPSPVVAVGAARFGNDLPLALIAGPCALESRAHALETAEALKEIAGKAGIGLVYKSSFDKANRTSARSARGMGLVEALPIFAEIRERTGLPVLTDVHEPDQCAAVATAVDVLQIPAFLCRQTDLLIAAALTGKVVNVKKGQFLAPWDMTHVVAKVVGAGNPQVLVTERGVSFGYNTLVSDMRALPILAETGAPVIFDATHSVQQPGGQGAQSGGERRFVPVLARAAVAVGVAGVFIETHQDPDRAPSDGPNMLPLKDLPPLLAELMAIDRLVKKSALAAPAIRRDALVRQPQSLGYGAELPEHVDGDAAARKPIAADAQIRWLDQIGDALADGDRRVFVERPVVAEAREIKFQRLRLEQPTLRRIVDDEMGEVRLAGDRAEAGEFRRGETGGVERLGMRVRHALEQRFCRRYGDRRRLAELLRLGFRWLLHRHCACSTARGRLSLRGPV